MNTVQRVSVLHYAKLRVDRPNHCYDMTIFRLFFKTTDVRHLGIICACLDRSRRVFCGIYHCAKFGWTWNRCSSFDNTLMLIFNEFRLKMPIHARNGCFWGYLTVTSRSTKGTSRSRVTLFAWSYVQLFVTDGQTDTQRQLAIARVKMTTKSRLAQVAFLLVRDCLLVSSSASITLPGKFDNPELFSSPFQGACNLPLLHNQQKSLALPQSLSNKPVTLQMQNIDSSRRLN